MELSNEIKPKFEHEKLVLTIGMFDGVHQGHQQIITQLNHEAERVGGKSALLSFNPHPRLVLQQNTDLKLLTLLEEKEELLKKYGLKKFIVQNFDIKFSRLSSVEFVRDFLVNKLKVHTLIIGHDHHFGRNREGDFNQLKELSELYGFCVKQLEAIEARSKPISSTKIRNALLNSDLEYANKALGYNYFMKGKIVSGDGIGRKIGFPTANIEVGKYKLIPKSGVYGVEVYIDGQKYFGVMNIGNRPTVEGKEKRLEVHIFELDDNLYQKEIKVTFIKFLRNEMKFGSLEALKVQISKDINEFGKDINRI